MTIAKFSGRRIRSTIAYSGEAPDDLFTQFVGLLGYRVTPLTLEMLGKPTLAADIDSVIFSQRGEKPLEIHHALETFASVLLSYDCRIYVRVTTHALLARQARSIVVNALATLHLPAGPLNLDYEGPPDQLVRDGIWLPLEPFVFICYSGLSWEALGKLVVENPSGEAPNQDLEIQAMDSEHQVLLLDEEEEVLIRRAFADCSEVQLVQMADGLSRVRAFRAYAVPAEGLLGPSPMIQFVKIGDRAKVVKEYENYESNALLYVPSHLCPRLNRMRCGLGATKGILVGDFVDEAEPLRDSANGGRAGGAISNLFNKTLRSWHQRGALDEVHSLGELLIGRLDRSIPMCRLERIKAIGGAADLENLRKRVMAVKSKPVRIGVTHGDLHATNVLVRGADAILIDFEKLCDNAPLLWDFASLEGGLLVESFAKDKRSADEWFQSIVGLYTGPIQHEPMKHDPRDPSAWFYACVRQIRLHARELECQPGQYRVVLAVALIAKGCNPDPFDEQCEGLRAAAFRFGGNYSNNY